MPVEDLRKDEMMVHLMDSLDAGKDIGHYGRLTFAMVARHFLSGDEVIEWLEKDADCDAEKARGLMEQVQGRGYNPPKRQRILDWMQEQEFPICPNADDPDSCNVYKHLKFPDEVYEHIAEYHEHKAS